MIPMRRGMRNVCLGGVSGISSVWGMERVTGEGHVSARVRG